MSWNGATDVQWWFVYEGESASRLSRVGSVRWKGFETEFLVGKPCVQVLAVEGGRISGSGAVCDFD